ncbi:2-amino-4-hydroxy-6-hydroxymethyldihydropteridine diphosphokinase [Arcticibacter svalbardensis]|uniref:2-amino-4-hydroxy-6- hydroxymethyldihydropteridine diphosphokinase n=1 Tax=Arcticibacter svalbardensis TaxID=1288027 RepID=UPI00058D568B|nr:2-amino-4-hydroxy-6-hydroxymethyldihydropteridine diphosphokinase [Arcticibacter svalbardensis]
MHTIYLLLGSNLGDRSYYLGEAANLVSEDIGRIIEGSSIYETDSWGIENQPKYLNQVLQVETELGPKKLLDEIHTIENLLGRVRGEKWDSRVIDVDILFYDQKHIQRPYLIIPHPLLHTRRFVLTPLNEIAPSLMHPVLKLQISELFKQLLDNLHVYKFFPTEYENEDI